MIALILAKVSCMNFMHIIPPAWNGPAALRGTRRLTPEFWIWTLLPLNEKTKHFYKARMVKHN